MITLYIYDCALQKMVTEVIANEKVYCEEAALNYGYNNTDSKYKWFYEKNENENYQNLKLIDARSYSHDNVEYCISVLNRVIEHSLGNHTINISEQDRVFLASLDIGINDPDLSLNDIIKFRDLLSESSIGKLLRQYVLPEMSITPQEWVLIAKENTENSKETRSKASEKLHAVIKKLSDEEKEQKKWEEWIFRVAAIIFMVSVVVVYYVDNLWISIPFGILWALSIPIMILFKPESAIAF